MLESGANPIRLDEVFSGCLDVWMFVCLICLLGRNFERIVVSKVILGI